MSIVLVGKILSGGVEFRTPTHKLFLLAIADFADEHSFAYPSLSRIMFRVGVRDKRNARRVIRELEEDGMLKTKVQGAVRPDGQPLPSNLYLILPAAYTGGEVYFPGWPHKEKSQEHDNTLGGAHRPGGGGPTGPGGEGPQAPLTVSEPSLEPSSSSSPVPGSASQEEQTEPGREDVPPFDPHRRRFSGEVGTPDDPTLKLSTIMGVLNKVAPIDVLDGEYTLEQGAALLQERVAAGNLTPFRVRTSVGFTTFDPDEQQDSEIEQPSLSFGDETPPDFTGGPNPHPPVSPALPGLPEGSTAPSPLEVLARLKGSPVAEKMAAKKSEADHDRRKRHAIRNSIEDATLRGIHEFIPDGYEHAIRMMRETAMKPEKLLEWLRQKPNIVPALNAMTKPLYLELLAEARKTAAKYGPADKWKQYAYVWFIEGAVARMPVQSTETGNLSHKLGMQSDKMAELRSELKAMDSLLRGAALVQDYVSKGWVDIGHRTPQEFAELYVGLG